MLSDEIRARLERLNRQALPDATVAPTAGGVTESTSTKRLPPQTVEKTPSPVPQLHLPLFDFSLFAPAAGPDAWSSRTVHYLEAGVEVENLAGRHLAIVHPLDRFGAELNGQLDRVQQAWTNLPALPPRTHPDIAALGRNFPRDALFLDLETCGLGSAMVFLVGLLHADDAASSADASSVHLSSGGLIVNQLLARNYAEERAVLATLWKIAAGKRLLITFNGKSFDWPLVHDRSTLHRLGRREFSAERALLNGAANPALLEPHEPRPELAHLDVLHHARRRWRKRLPNCRLQTLERYLCRRVRRDDVPGHEIPQAYHDYVRTGNARLIESILHHNALDLVTMTQVALRMLHETSTGQVGAISFPPAAVAEKSE